MQILSSIATAVEHLVTGETMQISTSREQRRRFNIFSRVHFVALVRCNIYIQRVWEWNYCNVQFFILNYILCSICSSLLISSGMGFQNLCSMEHYLQKTYYKTASLISNSCKAVAVLAGHTAEVSMLAYEYGRNLVCTILHFPSSFPGITS